MTYTPRHLRQRLSANAKHEREMADMRKLKSVPFVEVPFEWQTKQTSESAFFPSYGWVPHNKLRWRQPDGTVVPWSCGRQGDAFLMAAEYAERREPI